MKPKSTRQVDLANGPIVRSLLQFSIPLILTGLLQQLYTFFDSLIVGNLISSAALGAVNTAMPLISVFLFVINGIVTGCTVQVSHLTGAGRNDEVRPLALLSGGVVFAVSALLALICLAFAPTLLKWMKTPEDIFPISKDYFRIIAYGIPFLGLYNLTSAIARGCGDSRGPFHALLGSSLLNIALDLLFVGQLSMGISGAALATVISQLVCAVLMLLRLRRLLPGGGLRDGAWHAPGTRALFAECVRLALPAMLRSSLVSVGHVLITSVRNSLGAMVVEGISGAYNIDCFLLLPFLYMGNASSVFCGTNLAAKKLDRIRQGMRSMTLCLMAYELPMLAVILFGARSFLAWFGLDEACVAIGYRFLCTAAVFYPVCGVVQIFSGYFEGRKKVTVSSAVNVAALGLRIVLSYVLLESLQADVIAWAEIGSWLFGMAVFYGLYRRDQKTLES